jgi:hypothetical protein
LVFRPPQQQGGYRPLVPPQQLQQFGPRPNGQQFQQGSSTNRCFNCGSTAHFIKDRPQPRKPFQGQGFDQNDQGKGKKRVMQVQQGRVNFATLADLPEGAPIMTGIFSIDYKPVIILFDSSATHSFSNECGARVGLDSCQTKGSYMISTPGGKISSNQLLRYVPIQLDNKVIKTNLVLLHLDGMDIILGMNWMIKHKVLLDISS